MRVSACARNRPIAPQPHPRPDNTQTEAHRGGLEVDVGRGFEARRVEVALPRVDLVGGEVPLQLGRLSVFLVLFWGCVWFGGGMGSVGVWI